MVTYKKRLIHEVRVCTEAWELYMTLPNTRHSEYDALF